MLTQKTGRERASACVWERERERVPALWLLFFICFFLPLGLPYVTWASQEYCLFYPRSSLGSLDLPLFYFWGLFPFLSFSHCHSGLLFPIRPTFLPSRDGRPNSLGIGALRSLWLLPAEMGWQGALGLPLLLVSGLRVLMVASI